MKKAHHTKKNKKPQKLLGLTGSIGMGKSTTAKLLRTQGWQVQESDALVHAILREDNETTRQILKIYPHCADFKVSPLGGVDRAKLGAAILGDKAALSWLESLLHPAITKQRSHWARVKRAGGFKKLCADVPLLFEAGLAAEFSAIICVQAPAFLQKMRVLARPNMSAEKLEWILARQWPSRKKARCADVVLATGLGRAHTMRCLRRALLNLKNKGKI